MILCYMFTAILFFPWLCTQTSILIAVLLLLQLCVLWSFNILGFNFYDGSEETNSA